MATGTLSFGAGNLDIWVSKLNSDGTIDWQITYGGNEQEYANSIQQTSDGGYVLAGDTTSFGAGSYDAWILKLNSDGEISNCSAKSTSNATVSDTSAVISDTSGVPAVSAGVPANTTVTPLDSSAATDYVCLQTTLKKAMPWIPLLLGD